MFIPSWSEEKTKLLERFFEEGGSSTVISHRMGEHGYKVTRNAVIGKLHRLGLSGNKKATKDKPAPQRIRNAVISPTPPPRRLVPKLRHKVIVPRVNGGVMANPPAAARQVLLRETGEDDCRAIIGYRNGILADAVCCGKPRIWKMVKGKRERSPWCEEHNKRYCQEDRR